ncbi:unnamed protein product [Polarella glacialis]|uniref:Uncharacterized protein n=1 Tax=Polarella glacialis TaxID=89957 RepID=A0A813H313_POLGL|nr:unnamed protein product [Polarella glacialis]
MCVFALLAEPAAFCFNGNKAMPTFVCQFKPWEVAIPPSPVMSQQDGSASRGRASSSKCGELKRRRRGEESAENRGAPADLPDRTPNSKSLHPSELADSDNDSSDFFPPGQPDRDDDLDEEPAPKAKANTKAGRLFRAKKAKEGAKAEAAAAKAKAAAVTEQQQQQDGSASWGRASSSKSGELKRWRDESAEGRGALASLPFTPRSKKAAGQTDTENQPVTGQVAQEQPLVFSEDESAAIPRAEARRTRARMIREADEDFDPDQKRLEETITGTALEPEGKRKAATKLDEDEFMLFILSLPPNTKAKAEAKAVAKQPSRRRGKGKAKAAAKPAKHKLSKAKKANADAAVAKLAHSDHNSDQEPATKPGRPRQAASSKKQSKEKGDSQFPKGRGTKRTASSEAASAVIAAPEEDEPIRLSAFEARVAEESFFTFLRRFHPDSFLPDWSAVPVLDATAFQLSPVVSFGGEAGAAVEKAPKAPGAKAPVQVKQELPDEVPPCDTTFVQVQQELCDTAEAEEEEQQDPESPSHEPPGLAEVAEEPEETEELRRKEFRQHFADQCRAFGERKRSVIQARLAEEDPTGIFEKLIVHWTEEQLKRQTTLGKVRIPETKEQFLFRILKACPAMATKERLREYWKLPPHQPGSMVLWTEAFGRIDRETELNALPIWNGDTVFLLGEEEFTHHDAVKDELGELLFFESNRKGASGQRDIFLTHWKRLQHAILGEHVGIPFKGVRLKLLDTMLDFFLQKTPKSYRAFVPAIINSIRRYTEADKLELFRSCGVRPGKYDDFWDLLDAEQVEAELRRSVKYPLTGDAGREVKAARALAKVDANRDQQKLVKAETKVKKKQEDEGQDEEQEEEAPRRRGLRSGVKPARTTASQSSSVLTA